MLVAAQCWGWITLSHSIILQQSFTQWNLLVQRLSLLPGTLDESFWGKSVAYKVTQFSRSTLLYEDPNQNLVSIKNTKIKNAKMVRISRMKINEKRLSHILYILISKNGRIKCYNEWILVVWLKAQVKLWGSYYHYHNKTPTCITTLQTNTTDWWNGH
jgi:hypothetical protein